MRRVIKCVCECGLVFGGGASGSIQAGSRGLELHGASPASMVSVSSLPTLGDILWKGTSEKQRLPRGLLPGVREGTHTEHSDNAWTRHLSQSVMVFATRRWTSYCYKVG